MTSPPIHWAGLLVALAVNPAPAAAQAAQLEGKRIFETICVACHTIGAGVKIGPDLQGVTERREPAWLMRFIRDPEQVRKSGDSVAAANRVKYSIPMPNLGLTEPQVAAVIAHLGAAPAAAAVRPPLYLPTLALALVAVAGITLISLTLGTKRVETQA
ncbi:MAG TPA: cytochrome c [Gemmatimonadales bacterium]|nr:cytochrome c [Gemmatimonadales bacterium]